MLSPFDFFPFNVPAGTEFLRYYVIASIVVLGATWWIRGAVRDRLERPMRGTPSSPAHDSYRGGEAPAGQLEIGGIPRPEDVPALAYLFGGKRRVAETLVAGAFAEGWLSPELTIVAMPQGAAQRQFHERLPDNGEKLSYWQIHTAADAVAARMSPALRDVLERGGLLRTAATRRTLGAIVVGAGTLLIAVALVRMVVRSSLPGPAPFPLWLLLAMSAVGCVTFLMARYDKPRATNAYRSWLASVSHSLLADVNSGRRRDRDDIGLAVALSGLHILMAYPEMAAYAAEAQLHAAAAAWSPASGTGSSSGSSCGGGGGCGGGGCGGGGCS